MSSPTARRTLGNNEAHSSSVNVLGRDTAKFSSTPVVSLISCRTRSRVGLIVLPTNWNPALVMALVNAVEKFCPAARFTATSPNALLIAEREERDIVGDNETPPKLGMLSNPSSRSLRGSHKSSSVLNWPETRSATPEPTIASPASVSAEPKSPV